MSLDEKEIKEAIEFYRNWQPGGSRSSDDIEKYENILVTLAEHHLDIAGKMPEEKKETEECSQCGGIGNFPNYPHLKPLTCNVCHGIGQEIKSDYKHANNMRQECILAMMNALPSVEELEKIIEKTKWNYNAKILNGELTNMASRNYAEAIRERLEKGLTPATEGDSQ